MRLKTWIFTASLVTVIGVGLGVAGCSRSDLSVADAAVGFTTEDVILRVEGMT